MPGKELNHAMFVPFSAIISIINISQIGLRCQSSAAVQHFRTILQKQLSDVHDAGTYKNERILTSPQETLINIEGSSKKVINFCANNYLGMSVSTKVNFIHLFCHRIHMTETNHSF